VCSPPGPDRLEWNFTLKLGRLGVGDGVGSGRGHETKDGDEDSELHVGRVGSVEWSGRV